MIKSCIAIMLTCIGGFKNDCFLLLSLICTDCTVVWGIINEILNTNLSKIFNQKSFMPTVSIS